MAFVKHNKGKPQFHLVPNKAYEAVAIAMTAGIEAHGEERREENWKQCEHPDIFYDSGMRHLVAHRNGEIYDKDSGLTHLSHAVASFMIYLELEDERLKHSPLTTPADLTSCDMAASYGDPSNEQTGV